MTAKVRGTVLIVDDEAYVRESLAAMLGNRRFRTVTASSVQEALKAETLGGVDAVLADLKLPGEDGVDLVTKLSERHPDLPVVVLTAHGTVSSAVECMKAGAADYLLKPADPDELALVLERVLAQSSIRRELDYLRSGVGGMSARREPLGASEPWQKVLEMVELAAPTDSTVLLLGESGTGKEEVARLIHRNSGRARGPFVRVNCAAIPAELFESEFFGHRRGAFTGAVTDRDGRFRIAHGGTLLLDEIDALSPVAQAKVLRVIQDGSFERVGDSQPTWVDVRLICASNQDLRGLVEAGQFREDLFYRINVISMTIPPLRERREDVPLLVEAFLQEFSARLGKSVSSISAEAMAVLESYDWPGNVRELRNVIERGVVLERTTELSPSSLPFEGTLPGELARNRQGQGMRQALQAEERRLLLEALHRAGGVRREAARLLDIDERNLSYYLKKHGLMDTGKRG